MKIERLNLADLQSGAQLLASAFSGQPPVTMLFRSPRASEKLAYFMQCTMRYALLYGECHAPEDRSGVAAWLPPRATKMSAWRMWQAGMFSAPFHLGWRDFKAFGDFNQAAGAAHRAAISSDHFYLLAIGVSPQSQGKGIGRRLLEPMLEKADNMGLPIYLETQSPANVALYQRYGFAVTSETSLDNLGFRNWGMLRRA